MSVLGKKVQGGGVGPQLVLQDKGQGCSTHGVDTQTDAEVSL